MTAASVRVAARGGIGCRAGSGARSPVVGGAPEVAPSRPLTRSEESDLIERLCFGVLRDMARRALQ